ncbi:unnamed protein product, partial [marine sediment metagenome]
DDLFNIMTFYLFKLATKEAPYIKYQRRGL